MIKIEKRKKGNARELGETRTDTTSTKWRERRR